MIHQFSFFVVDGDDLIGTNKNVKDYKEPLKRSLHDENPSLRMFVLSWALESREMMDFKPFHEQENGICLLFVLIDCPFQKGWAHL